MYQWWTGASAARLPSRAFSQYKLLLWGSRRGKLGGPGPWSDIACNVTMNARFPGPPAPPDVLDFHSSMRTGIAADNDDVLHLLVPLPSETGGIAITSLHILVDGTTMWHHAASQGERVRLHFDPTRRGRLMEISSIMQCHGVWASEATRCVIAAGRSRTRAAVGISAVCSACSVSRSSHSGSIQLVPPPGVAVRPAPGQSTTAVVTWAWGSSSKVCLPSGLRPGMFQMSV